MSICAPCAYAADEGWWGHDTLPDDTWTHCDDCHTSFPGTQRWGHCKASGCHQTFSGVSTFDAHRQGSCPLPDTSEGYTAGNGKAYKRKFHEKGQFHYFGSADPYPYPERTSA